MRCALKTVAHCLGLATRSFTQLVYQSIQAYVYLPNGTAERMIMYSVHVVLQKGSPGHLVFHRADVVEDWRLDRWFTTNKRNRKVNQASVLQASNAALASGQPHFCMGNKRVNGQLSTVSALRTQAGKQLKLFRIRYFPIKRQ